MFKVLYVLLFYFGQTNVLYYPDSEPNPSRIEQTKREMFFFFFFFLAFSWIQSLSLSSHLL